MINKRRNSCRIHLRPFIHGEFDKIHPAPTLLYGGGINEHNINDIYNIEELQGILIGGISSNIDELENLLLRIDEK